MLNADVAELQEKVCQVSACVAFRIEQDFRCFFLSMPDSHLCQVSGGGVQHNPLTFTVFGEFVFIFPMLTLRKLFSLHMSVL